MTKRVLELAATFLADYSDHLSNNGCNDWKWPKDWTSEDKREFTIALWEADEKKPLEQFDQDDLECVQNEIEGEYGPGDFRVADYLATLLRKEAQKL